MYQTTKRHFLTKLLPLLEINPPKTKAPSLHITTRKHLLFQATFVSAYRVVRYLHRALDSARFGGQRLKVIHERCSRMDTRQRSQIDPSTSSYLGWL